jgi:hypothetical protein
MFFDNDLINHLQSKNGISIDPLVIAEWNQNILTNIQNYGNYRYRPYSASVNYQTLSSTYDSNDALDLYTDALESQNASEYLALDEEKPAVFLSDETERQMYYSLKECFNPFRPRSGINKILFFDGKYVDSVRSGRRPRYYFSSRKDQFKYWTSYRKEVGQEFGVSSTSASVSTGYPITDVAPFIVYKEEVAANRIVIKMQTNLADPNATGIDGEQVVGSNIRVDNSLISDPLQNLSKSSIPKRWRVQYLDSNDNWNDAVVFDQDSLRRDNSRIVPWDGYVELSYGIKIPDEYRESFHFIGYVGASTQLPINAINGQSYVVGEYLDEAGELYIWNTGDQEWDISPAEYGFSLLEDDDTKRIGLVEELVDPLYFIQDGEKVYRDFTFIKGLRINVETMYAPNVPFDLIEMSPRLKCNFTDYVIDFSINKELSATDYGLPIGGLAASTGNLNVSNHNNAFTENNIFDKESGTGSIVYNNLKPQIRFDFYETILNVNGADKFVPLKSLYSENSISANSAMNDISLSLRDAFFRLETANAPSLFIQNCTLTTAVATMLDNVGFGNYIFKGISTANDPVIPFFFVEPDASVAEILERLAQSTQTAMFFDEYNNFVIMPKEYLLPDISVRDTDTSISERLITLYGQKSGSVVPNIETISGSDTKIINDGKINYTTRYIQRDISRLEQAELPDGRDRTYGYKSALLWEIGEQESSKTSNKPVGKEGYGLGAVTLNTDLSNVVPYVENHEIKENIIDVGPDVVYYLPRFQGYLYANGEVIRYDAKEFTVSGFGNVWIANNQEYQKYFSKLPFNGKIWESGRLRIYVEPYYEELTSADIPGLESGVTYKNGVVKSHGRGQFGTSVVNHYAGLNSYWTNLENKKSFRMDSKYIFSTTPAESIEYPILSAEISSSIGNDEISKGKSEISGKVVNPFRNTVRSESNSSTIVQTEGTVQSSAMVFSGPKTFTPQPTGLESTSSRDVVTYVYKEFDRDYMHVGTRMRIIGSKVDDTNQNPQNATTYFNTTNTLNQSSELTAASGGIAYMLDKNNNSGYYFEICALSKDVLNYFNNTTSVSTNFAQSGQVLHNIIFYKVLNKTTNTAEAGKTNIAVPVKLWGSTAEILVDSGTFVGQGRLNQANPTVYDLGIESERIGENTYRFYLYLNNALVATVDDTNPLPSIKSNSGFNAALFTRSSSKCMFENIYALKNRAGSSNSVTVSSTLNNSLSLVGDNNITVSEAMRKYAMSGIIQSTYLSSIGSEKPPGYEIYFEEFGTILRECAYFNIKYDQAYPALIAQMVPIFNSEKTYVVSGFLPGSYGAEFLIFNTTDMPISLSEEASNFLAIQGITFTQNISNVLTVDDYFKEISNMSDPLIVDGMISSPESAQKIYGDIKSSRSIYGNKAFSLDSSYIQDEDSARSLMSWMINKTIKPRRVLEISAFAIPHIQIGDIVKVDYDIAENVKIVDENKRFIVMSVNYKRTYSDVLSQIRLLEV